MGIDYGMGTVNIDKATGIRYGVIGQNDVLQAWADSSEQIYPELENETCETCGGNGEIENEEGDICECSDCEGEGTIEPGDDAYDYLESIGAKCTDSDYDAECGDCGDIFITRSPYFTRCGYCSPCAPGAGYLMDRADDCRAYCFGHDWFEDGKAPYPVYRVSDGAEVFPD